MRIFLAIWGLMATASAELVDFDTRVLPILTKAGCNTGACHGAAAGRGELRLSLYGSRPEADFQQLTQALEGRRVNHRLPEQSLLLLKPTEQVSHEGGTRLDIDGSDYATVLQWVRQGAMRQSVRTLKTFTFQRRMSAGPTDTVLQAGDSVQLSAVAEFSDGPQDVLDWTVIQAADPSATAVSQAGMVTVHRPGRHLLIARFMDRVVPLELLVATDTNPTSAAEQQSDDADTTQLDRFIDLRLQRLQLTAAASVSDPVFVRRLHLDLIGRLPDPDVEAQRHSDTADETRSEMIDRLLQSDEFTDYWTWVLSGMLRVSAVKPDAGRSPTSPTESQKMMRAKGQQQAASSLPVSATASYYGWLRTSVAGDVGLDRMARQLVLAEGSPREHGPAGFYEVTQDARAQAEFFSRTFLGVRLQCANCHDHPLDAWTQNDYHGLAAIFAGIRRQPVIRFVASSEIIHPATQEPALPKIPGSLQLLPHRDHRPQLVDWLTSPDNPYFAKAIVNRIWKQLLGVGLVEPVDDLRVTNPATHPELLDWLAAEFAADGYRLRPTIRRICRSRVYQRSSVSFIPVEQPAAATVEANDGEDLTAKQNASAQTELSRTFYAIGRIKPLAAAVYLDAVADVTGVGSLTAPFAGRAVSLAGIQSAAKQLQPLSQCQTADCEDARSVSELSLSLHLLTGDTLNSRISDRQGRLMQAVEAGAGADELLDVFYPRAFGREVAPAERQFWQQQLNTATNRAQFAEIAQDFLWSLLNSSEFRANH